MCNLVHEGLHCSKACLAPRHLRHGAKLSKHSIASYNLNDRRTLLCNAENIELLQVSSTGYETCDAACGSLKGALLHLAEGGEHDDDIPLQHVEMPPRRRSPLPHENAAHIPRCGGVLPFTVTDGGVLLEAHLHVVQRLLQAPEARQAASLHQPSCCYLMSQIKILHSYGIALF